MIVYDTGALVAGDKGQRAFWIRHRALLERGVIPVVPATVLAQAWTGRAREAMLARLINSCAVDDFTLERARRVGALRVSARHHDVVDVSVVECAWRRQATIVTSDPGDIAKIVAVVPDPIPIETV